MKLAEYLFCFVALSMSMLSCSKTIFDDVEWLKAMFLCYTDGQTQFMLDSTIQAETGKNEERP